ncbi:MAG: hypothetical protein AUK47_12310 [Deltaproteobacteria bacterium CG2_30_63_29]|nr:MAG: hypothetical protein AUK47_12310 [Deltaproteobacteria bacterium CG2_30_63_29]PIV99513.1 MAG: site-2 protease family protein [Deltaproteobacteria bacterium CG17_big_fil_post_rev_8_21_14_2_50_63_7]PJB38814.1 MAG: site-2 protease family protein [Deltaproteobacteria bacterium CG_4_9_14_3_um_filter_63_12]
MQEPQASERPESDRYHWRVGLWKHLGLFLLTVLVILLWWRYYSAGNWTDGAWYAGGVLAILSAHEFGHYFAARHYGVDVTLPYYLPGIPPLYTFGAFIKMRASHMSRTALLVVGAAGPIAGALVALPVYIVGLSLSGLVEVPPVRDPLGMMFMGDSVLGWLLIRLQFGVIPAGTDVYLHPLAYAGWVGFFVTALNLVPVGQLDGGHVNYALFGTSYRRYSRWLYRLMIVCGLLLHPMWLVLSIFLLFTGVEHPPMLRNDDVLPRWAKGVGYACIGVFVLTFMPVPIVVPPLWELLATVLG